MAGLQGHVDSDEFFADLAGGGAPTGPEASTEPEQPELDLSEVTGRGSGSASSDIEMIVMSEGMAASLEEAGLAPDRDFLDVWGVLYDS